MVKTIFTLKEGKNYVPNTEATIRKLDNANFYAHVAELLPSFYPFDNNALKKALDKNVELNPNSVDAKILCLIHEKIPNSQRMMADLEAAEPNNPNLLTLQGDIILNNGIASCLVGGSDCQDQIKKARSFYRRAIKFDNNLAKVYIGLGKVYAFLPNTEPLQEGVIGLQTAGLYLRNQDTYKSLVTLLIRQQQEGEMPSPLKGIMSFGDEKEKIKYAFILDAVEMLNDLHTVKSQQSAQGLLFVNGAPYVGSLVNNRPSGIGKLMRPNGSIMKAISMTV